MKWISIILGVFAILLTLKPFIKNSNWFIRMGDFPRLQILFLLLVALGLFFVVFDFQSFADYIFALALIACAIYQMAAILPFTIFYRKEVQTARESDSDFSNLSILIFNIMMENREFQRVLDLIEKYDPNLVLLAEPNDWWAEKLAPLKLKYPNIVLKTLDNHFGMMLFSRLSLEDIEIKFLIEEDVPSIHAKIKLPSGDFIAFHGIHPRPPVPEENGRSTERDGELFLVGKSVRQTELPSIVAGDMNDAAWSRTTRLFKNVSGLLDPRVGRGFYNTFHAKYPFLRLPLDHIFHSHHFRLKHLERIKDSCGSDHFPVLVSLSLESDAAANQQKPEPEGSEKQEADDIVATALNENQ